MEEIDYRREQIRGLFTLGLLAVLVSLRLTVEPEATTELFGMDFSVIGWIDFTLELRDSMLSS